MMRSFCVALLCLVTTPFASAQQLHFPGAAIGNDTALAKAMSALAEQVIATYKDNDRDRYLDNRFRLQMIAGRYGDAAKTLTALRALRTSSVSPQAGATNVQYAILARARQRADGRPFDEAFRQAFRDAVGRLDDRTSALVMRGLGVDRSTLEQALNDALERQRGQDTISLADALALLKAYQVERAYRTFTPLAGPLIAEDDRRRYLIDRNVLVRTADGAAVCAMVVRPRSVSGRLPTLLNFTIYADSITSLNEARRTASNGYAGVEGFTRGKACSPDTPVPYEHDGSDAAAVIDWISAQTWSDGRVGMYGGSYEGFTQWAAAKHMPPALKALMPSVTVAPGIDVPMEGGVFQSFVYYWPFYTTTNKTLDDAPLKDRARWWRMNREWYVSGRPYRSLDAIDGTPNRFFDRWLDHPSYDAYWQGMIPYQQDFARINIPVLTTTGYYDGGQIGALYYFTQHYANNPRAEHYLLIGPYDHISGQRGTMTALGTIRNVVRGYVMDSVAQIDIGELRYQWFDYVFKGRPKPALLQDRVNYEVMGANRWRHVPSLAAMGQQTLWFHLSALGSGDAYRLSDRTPTVDTFVTQTVDFADRTDVDRASPTSGDIIDPHLDTWTAVAFVSDPLPEPTELSGLFSGQLDFRSNKSDFDLAVELYKLTAQGEYVELSFYLARASYVADRSHRHLLTPGQRQQLPFTSGRLTSRLFQPGSRLVVVLRVIKAPGAQINYGTGRDVSDETIADAKEPLKIEWLGDSFIDVPVRRR